MATLTLEKSETSAAVSAAPAPEPMEMRVFTPEHIERLGRLNTVVRRLRGLGYQVVQADAATPSIHIQPGRTDTLRPLMHLAGASTQCLNGSGRVSIDGVGVCWQAKPQAFRIAQR